MGFQSPSHANAHAIQGQILTALIGKKSSRAKSEGDKPKDVDAFELCKLAETWIKMEQFKRELRGIPSLKPADAGHLLKRAETRLRQLANAEPIEVE